MYGTDAAFAVAGGVGLLRGGIAVARSGYGIYKDIRALDGPLDLAGNIRTPLGFENSQDFSAFGSSLYRGLSGSGYGQTRGIMQGSSVTGQSYRTGEVFDSFGRVSDYDVALAGDDIFQRAVSSGIDIRQGVRTGPLSPKQVNKLGLSQLARQLSGQSGRPVNFMIYNSPDTALMRSPSIQIPGFN